MAYLENKPLRLHDFNKMRDMSDKITCLTAYDASFATLIDQAGIDLILVGDSLGNVIQGEKTTLPVTIDHMVYHTSCVVRGTNHALVIADLPFGTYQKSQEQAFENACKLMAAGAQMVKLEGGAFLAQTVSFLVERGIPVCAHIGLTPQSVHQLGGYRVQGKSDAAAEALLQDALALEKAGATFIVLEMVPAALGKRITDALTTALTIGIGAGVDCHGQVLVLYDVLGVYPGKKPKFSKDFMASASSLEGAVKSYISAVKDLTFPALENSF